MSATMFVINLFYYYVTQTYSLILPMGHCDYYMKFLSIE